jgi:hypothetical protein
MAKFFISVKRDCLLGITSDWIDKLSINIPNINIIYYSKSMAVVDVEDVQSLQHLKSFFIIESII